MHAVWDQSCSVSLEKAGGHEMMCQMLQQLQISMESRRAKRHQEQLRCAEIPTSRAKHTEESFTFLFR